MQHRTYWALTVFHSLLHNHVTNNSKNTCKAAHNFLAKRMPTNQRKVPKHTLRGGLKLALTTLHLQSSHAVLYSGRCQCTGKKQTAQRDGRSLPLTRSQRSRAPYRAVWSARWHQLKPEQDTSLYWFLGSPVNVTELIKCGTFLISTIVWMYSNPGFTLGFPQFYFSEKVKSDKEHLPFTVFSLFFDIRLLFHVNGKRRQTILFFRRWEILCNWALTA